MLRIATNRQYLEHFSHYFAPYFAASVSQGCKVEARSWFSFFVKGKLFLSRDLPEQASIAFSQSNSVEKTVDAFIGEIVCCCCCCHAAHGLGAMQKYEHGLGDT
jgi:hypothetical protein